MQEDKELHRLMQLHPAVAKYHSKGKNINEEEKAKVEKAYKAALNQLASTEDGKIFLKCLLAYCKVFNYNDTVNPTLEVVDSTKRKVWLEMIRPYLAKENIIKVEV